MDIDRLFGEYRTRRNLSECVEVDDENACAWVASVLGTEFGPWRCLAVYPRAAQDTIPDVAVVYHDWREREGDIMMSIVANRPQWCRPQVVDMFLRYPFEMLGCRRITTQVDTGNERSMRFTLGVGFHLEGVLREYFDGRDCAIFGMLRREWERSRRNRNKVVH